MDGLQKVGMRSTCFKIPVCRGKRVGFTKLDRSVQTLGFRHWTLWARIVDTWLIEIVHPAAEGPLRGPVGTSDQTLIMSALPLAGVTVIEVRGEDVARLLTYHV